MKYRVITNDDGEYGALPDLYDTYEEAEQAGREWRRSWDDKTADWQPDGEWHSAWYQVEPKAMSSKTGSSADAELEPCPFCGGKRPPSEHSAVASKDEYTSHPVLEALGDDVGGGWRVMCYGCGIQTANGLHRTAKDAVFAWNLRQPSTK